MKVEALLFPTLKNKGTGNRHSCNREEDFICSLHRGCRCARGALASQTPMNRSSQQKDENLSLLTPDSWLLTSIFRLEVRSQFRSVSVKFEQQSQEQSYRFATAPNPSSPFSQSEPRSLLEAPSQDFFSL